VAEGSWFVEAPPAEPAESSAAFERLYRAFLAARAALGLALIGAQLIAAVLSTRPAPSTMALSASYAAAAVALWLLPQLRRGASARSLARVSCTRWTRAASTTAPSSSCRC
jgi:two-component system sensor histidine kinase PilS (NtrC family)